VRQVHVWFRQEKNHVGRLSSTDRATGAWNGKAPVYNTVLHIPTNPIYAGAYAFGLRSASKVTIENGRNASCAAFAWSDPTGRFWIRDHHEGYIGWDEFEKESAPDQRQRQWKVAGRARLGAARRSLAGWIVPLRPLRAASFMSPYGGAKGDVARYHCRGASINHVDGPLYLLRQSSRRRRGRGGGDRTRSAASAGGGAGRSGGRGREDAAKRRQRRTGATAGSLRGCARPTAI